MSSTTISPSPGLRNGCADYIRRPPIHLAARARGVTPALGRQGSRGHDLPVVGTTESEHKTNRSNLRHSRGLPAPPCITMHRICTQASTPPHPIPGSHAKLCEFWPVRVREALVVGTVDWAAAYLFIRFDCEGFGDFDGDSDEWFVELSARPA